MILSVNSAGLCGRNWLCSFQRLPLRQLGAKNVIIAVSAMIGVSNGQKQEWPTYERDRAIRRELDGTVIFPPG
jgi:hypothetical protein